MQNHNILEAMSPTYQSAGAELDFVREKNGVVYTKAWVVDLILDLVGYVSDKRLAEMFLVEPSAGDGSFLLRSVERLAESCARFNIPLIEARSAILAYELDDMSAERARSSVRSLLRGHCAKPGEIDVLVESWIKTGDYLTETQCLKGRADFVVGNPPYIRLENLDNGGALYRSLYSTMVGRSDIYIAFFEAALKQLKPEGVCGFICADRWMFNQYGAELRRFVTSGYSVEAVIQMHNANAFDAEVSAYPAVTIIRKSNQSSTVVACFDPLVERLGVKVLIEELQGLGYGRTNAARVDSWFKGSAPWPLMNPEKLALLRRLEGEFPTLEGTGATVGIGVATGADKVFITKDAYLVESERLLPLAMAMDVKGCAVKWSGHYLVNPWSVNGLVDLAHFPRLAAYFAKHEEKLSGRHVGLKAPATWYRTIDKVNATLTCKAKLYLPDFKGRIAPVLDRGETYPHHNLYFIEPGLWDVEVLGGLLLSDVAQFFIEAYGVRMRGGYLRFQAQYVRRICLPYIHEVSEEQSERLRNAFETHKVALANAVAAEIYGLNQAEKELFRG